MSSPPGAERLPTLTEVVAARRAAAGDAAPPAAAAPAPEPSREPTAEERLVRQVLAELGQRVDLVLESRLREALAPVIARAADSMVRELRAELAATLRDLVARAVAHELSKARDAAAQPGAAGPSPQA